ncbi:hypothetical protein DNU06_10945 [Putridiphycobacter roseus]|uniref:Fe/B12 periplasmic-binding domain-containing protein n=1 Tax=Putridiphycobacter roseus TaxID=2219161 RepID=A0A2W1MX99_9FLAO|nr:ABC transporter substrate-binding protein [Putridiphycobacter roseus]PZE16769.1 hypothetical protein DNU06_10945 [Putridiphycobacter roseus]
MKLILISLMLCLVACQPVQKKEENSSAYLPISAINIEVAKGFNIVETDSTFKMIIHSLSPKYQFEDSLVFPKKSLKKPFKHLINPIERIACQSSTHLIFINALNNTQKVKGISEMQYMPKDSLYQVLESNHVVEINKNGEANIEKLLAIHPDVFLVYPFEWQSDRFKKVNIKTLLVSEYMETTPLGRLEWIKFFGILLNESEKAATIFKEKSRKYEALVVPVDTSETIFFNLPFNDTWDMPAPNSISGNLLKDAGYQYIYANLGEGANDNLVQSKEKVWLDAMNAKYWLIIANRPQGYSLADLKQEETIYKEFKAVKDKKVIFCNTGYSPYFTQGIIAPDEMLKELLEIKSQGVDYAGVYFRYLK